MGHANTCNTLDMTDSPIPIPDDQDSARPAGMLNIVPRALVVICAVSLILFAALLFTLVVSVLTDISSATGKYQDEVPRDSLSSGTRVLLSAFEDEATRVSKTVSWHTLLELANRPEIKVLVLLNGGVGCYLLFSLWRSRSIS